MRPANASWQFFWRGDSYSQFGLRGRAQFFWPCKTSQNGFYRRRVVLLSGRIPCPESRYIATITHSPAATAASRGRGAGRGSRPTVRSIPSHSSEESTEPLYRTEKGQAAGTCAPRTPSPTQNLLSAPIARASRGSPNGAEEAPVVRCAQRAACVDVAMEGGKRARGRGGPKGVSLGARRVRRRNSARLPVNTEDAERRAIRTRR